MLRAGHGRHLVGHGAQRPAGRERHDQRLALGEIGRQVLGGGDGDAGARAARCSSRRAAPSSRRGRSASRSSSPSAMHSAIGWSSRNLISFSLTASDTSRCTAWRETLSCAAISSCALAGDVVEPRRAGGEIELAVLLAQPLCLPVRCGKASARASAQTIDNCHSGRDRLQSPANGLREATRSMAQIVTIGEILVEIMATRIGQTFLEPGLFAGPYPSGAPAIFADQAARVGAATALIGCVGPDDFGTLNLEPPAGQRRRRARRSAAVPGTTTGSAFVTYRADGGRDFIFNIANSAAAALDAAQLEPGAVRGLPLLPRHGLVAVQRRGSRPRCGAASSWPRRPVPRSPSTPTSARSCWRCPRSRPPSRRCWR